MGTAFTHVLIADGKPEIRYKLQLMLAHIPGMVVVGEACNGDDAIEQAGILKPDVLIMDIGIEGLGGLEVIRRVRNTHPAVKILIHTAIEPAAFVIAALRAGASGYSLYGCSHQVLESALKAVRAGAVWLDEKIAARILNFVQGTSSSATGTHNQLKLEELKPKKGA